MSKKGGFTLVEVLISLFIFVISFVALTANAMYVYKYQRVNEERQQAIFKANFILNYLMGLDFANSCLSIGSHNCSSDDGTCCTDQYKGSANIAWMVEDGPDSGITKKISVVVNFKYQDYRGNVQLTSIKGAW